VDWQQSLQFQRNIAWRINSKGEIVLIIRVDYDYRVISLINPTLDKETVLTECDGWTNKEIDLYIEDLKAVLGMSEVVKYGKWIFQGFPDCRMAI
jgi:hypothetical protein